jgi:hypothetical protein
MNTPQATPKQMLKMLTILFLALLVGPVMFIMVSILARQGGGFDNQEPMEEILLPMVAIAAILGIVGGGILFRQQIKKVSPQQALTRKIQQYQVAILLRLAVLEAPTLLAVVGFLLTGNLIFLGMALALLLMMGMRRPSLTEAIESLALTAEEERELRE